MGNRRRDPMRAYWLPLLAALALSGGDATAGGPSVGPSTTPRGSSGRGPMTVQPRAPYGYGYDYPDSAGGGSSVGPARPAAPSTRGPVTVPPRARPGDGRPDYGAGQRRRHRERGYRGRGFGAPSFGLEPWPGPRRRYLPEPRRYTEPGEAGSMSVGPPVQNPTDRGPVTTPAPSRPRAPIVPPGLSGNADQLRSGEGVLPLSPPRGDRRRHRGTQPPVGLLGGDGVRVLLAFDAATRCGRVFVDGQFVDTAQTLDGGVLRLAAGVHRVEVTCPGYRPFHTRFAAGAGEILRLRVGLERN